MIVRTIDVPRGCYVRQRTEEGPGYVYGAVLHGAFHATAWRDDNVMLHKSLVLLIISLIATILGLSDFGAVVGGAAKALFVVTLVFFFASLSLGRPRVAKPKVPA
ncbi:hypothetical protein [Tahibacter soli]|uniref:UPF0391 membrane protein OD750_023555 n=1 Tax=Tahibacter soli TaxID=2983605 RepID=A0A9X3YR25_9GAMM|nr:hypothetical protein [Tahibacter soli]MDC8015513.1 hypothetical protein [Tahibacter soli]